MHTRVVQPGACGLGQVSAADLDNVRVDLDHVDVLNVFVAGQLADDTAVTGTDDQHFFDVRMHGHGHMHDHFVIDEFVLFGQHHIAVQRQETAEFGRLKDINALKLALTGVELAVNADGQLDIGCVMFGKP